MKIVIERAVIYRCLSHIQSVVERRNTIPILANILIQAKDGEVLMVATDMDLEMTDSRAANVLEEGSITVPALMLYEIVRKLPDGCDITIQTQNDGANVAIKSGKSNFKLGCLPTADFPRMPSESVETKFDILAADLRSLIDRTYFSISTDEIRFYLNGIYFHVMKTPEGEDILRAVSTDGHRLARAQVSMPQGAENMPGFILPKKTVLELRKLLDEAVDKVEVSVSKSKIQLCFDTIVLKSKLIDGTYPDYEKAIPVSNEKSFIIPTQIFAKAVDRVATLSNEKSRAIKLHIADNHLTLSATGSDSGSAVEEMDVDYNDVAVEMGFNAKYVLDITQQIKGENIRVDFTDTQTPTVVREAASEQALYVLMPMRV